MKENTNPIRNTKLSSSLDKMEEAALSLSDDLRASLNYAVSQAQEITEMQAALQALADRKGIALPKQSIPEEQTIVADTSNQSPSNNHKQFRIDTLSDIDIAVACVAGGLGILIDFLVVKIPKSTNIIRNRETIHQTGSPLTEWMRKIGFEENGKTAPWVKTLEKWFDVNYDISVMKGEKGFNPKTHRLYSLAHDPSPSGLLWAIKDMANGTFSYIDKSGKLKIVPTPPNQPLKVLISPIIWLGHLISDIFTKAGLPLPGSSFLRTLQFGSFGEKKRTIGQVVEYMYLEGYDVRHLATMSLVNACVEIIIRIYHTLTKPRVQEFARPAALIQAEKEMLRHKLQKMRLCGYAVASAGNLAKLAAYQWNPTAFNAPAWIALARTSIAELEYQTSTAKEIIDIMEVRSEIEANFDHIQAKLSQL